MFGAGDLAFTKEAQTLIPGIETVAVKSGNRPGRGDELSGEAYGKRNIGAIHRTPQKARELIAAGARRALVRARTESFGLIDLTPPFERVAVFRGDDGQPPTYSVETHPSDVIALMGAPFDPKPVESDDQLRELLGE